MTASIVSDPTRAYNGTTAAALTSANFTLSGLVSGQSFTVNQTAGTYNSANVTTATAVTASLSATNFTAGSGTLASNYTLPTTASGAGSITPATVTASIIGDPTRAYNGTTTATLTSANFSLSGLVSGQSFTVNQTTGAYNSPNVVSATTVTASLSATNFTAGTGTLASNYTLPTTASGPGSITAYAFNDQIGNDSHLYGSTANLAADLGTTISTGVNGENLDITYSSTGNTTTAIAGTYPITGTLSNGTGATSNYTVTLLSGTLTVTMATGFYILDPTAGGALTLSGSAGINIPGNVVIDSKSSSALAISGTASVKAGAIQVVGGVQKSGSPTLSPQPLTGITAVSDPLAALPMPAIPTGLTNYGSKSISGSTTTTIQSGIYSQISISGAAKVTLAAGTYVIQGGGFTASGSAVVTISAGTSIILEGGGLSVSGAAAVSGTNVTIFNFGTAYNGTTDGGTFGPITLSGSGSVSLTPPSSGTYAGMLIFQGRDNTKALTFSGSALQGITGTIYAPAAQLVESGSAQVGSSKNTISIIVDTMTLSGAAIADGLNLSSPSGTVAYTPAQIRDAYGINALTQDGSGQTIAIVDAYDDPDIDQSLDAYDSQFSLTDSGSALFAQYGPASSFLTVLNQQGQATSLPSTDPTGPGTDNWELEEALDVEWVHSIAPGAQIILVEANSQSLSDLMASVATAASQPGVSVVSMSWGFPEGQAVFAADEATYDSEFNVPGVTFVASTGDYGVADPEYPAFSPNVVAVGGTSLTLNGDNSYNSETGWGYYSDAAGTSIGSGGGISLYEPEPAYQQGVQSLGSRTTPDVSLVADPATGAWIADPYDLDPSDPFEVVGGTSLSAPSWAGLLLLVNQARAKAAQPLLNSTDPTETLQALYRLPQADYHEIDSGSNGYTAESGYNLVTGLGTPVANLLVSDLVAYQGPQTTYSGPTVGPLQDANLDGSWTNDGGPIDVLSVFDSFVVSNNSGGSGHDLSPSPALSAASSTVTATGFPEGVTHLSPITTSAMGATFSSSQVSPVLLIIGSPSLTVVMAPPTVPLAMTAGASWDSNASILRRKTPGRNRPTRSISRFRPSRDGTRPR